MSEMRINTAGSLIGWVSPKLCRTAARTYVAHGEANYTVYLENLAITSIKYRCQCECFIFNGRCKHGFAAIKAERVLRKTYPDVIHDEDKRRRRHKLIHPVLQPFE